MQSGNDNESESCNAVVLMIPLSMSICLERKYGRLSVLSNKKLYQLKVFNKALFINRSEFINDFCAAKWGY